MRTYFKLFILSISVLASVCSASALTGSYTAFLSKVAVSEIPDELEETQRRRRTLPLPIECTISAEGGVEIAGYSGDIISYEICDAETESVLAVFSDETGFVSHLLTLSGEYQVRFETPDYIYAGYIYL